MGLGQKYGIPKSTLNNRSGGMQTCQKSLEACQALTSVIEKALERWALQMGTQGFPRGLDIFKAMAEKLHKRAAMV